MDTQSTTARGAVAASKRDDDETEKRAKQTRTTVSRPFFFARHLGPVRESSPPRAFASSLRSVVLRNSLFCFESDESHRDPDFESSDFESSETAPVEPLPLTPAPWIPAPAPSPPRSKPPCRAFRFSTRTRIGIVGIPPRRRDPPPESWRVDSRRARCRRRGFSARRGRWRHPRSSHPRPGCGTGTPPSARRAAARRRRDANARARGRASVSPRRHARDGENDPARDGFGLFRVRQHPTRDDELPRASRHHVMTLLRVRRRRP